MSSVSSPSASPDAEDVSLSQPRQDETTCRTLTAEELKQQCDVAAMMLAADYASKKCDIHENCDESCSATIAWRGNPLMERSTLLAAILMPMAAKRPTRATDQDVPRDADWARAQHLHDFEYSPLDTAQEIRVLRVKKGLFRADVVECELVTLALGQGSKYDALSYYWGPPDMTEVMICDGRIRFITPTLSAALKAYRESKGEESLLWVDAVSINQTDHEEMSQQIPLMRKIYSEATEVFVHLGHARPDTSLGLDLMRRLAITYMHISRPKEVGAIEFKQDDLPGHGEAWFEYFKVYESPWFRRTWVLQEVALSQRAVLSLGRFVVPWAALEDSLHMIQHAKLLQIMAPHMPDAYPGVVGLMQMCQIRELTRSPDEHSLLKVLQATRNFKVSDPRDKIIAVLGLTGELSPELEAMIDYRLTVAQVYHRAAAYLINTGHSTEVLEHAGLQRQAERPGLPSWAPDWFTDKRENNEPPLSLFRPAPFSAGGFTRVCYIPGDEDDDPYPRELVTLGLCHHKIVAVSHLDEGSQIGESTSSAARVYMAWYRYAEQCWKNADHLVYEDREEAFARTLLVNDTYSGRNKVDYSATITDVVAVFRSAIQAMEEVMQSDKPDQSYFELLNLRRMNQVSTFLMQMNAAMRGRRLAVTDTGYLGLVPACSQVGDRMAILFGFRTPFVIRLTAEIETLEVDNPPLPQFDKVQQARARLVGDAYMHGIMEGEALQEAKETLRAPCGIILT